MVARFLTPEEKVAALAEFERYKAEPDHWRSAHPDDAGGHGRIDHEVLPLVDALNALDGVCTVQSCCGHRWPISGHGPGAERVHCGQLWIRLDERMARLFDDRVGDLLASPAISHVQKLYAYPESDAPHEVFDIQWRDGDSLPAAAQVIQRFFTSLAGVRIDGPRPKPSERVSDWRITAEWDWTLLDQGDELHAVAVLDNEATVDDDWYGDGTTECGQRGSLTIPGLFTRMGAKRCDECCAATGMPKGDQSPKNQDDCRPIAGTRVARV